MLKRLLVASPFVALSFLLSFEVGITSCQKKIETIVDTITRIRVDTLIQIRVDTLKEKDTLLTSAILTANPWKPLEMRGLVNNTYVYYVRGGSGNTQSFDNEYMTFNANNTGIYHDNAGGESSFTWHFTDSTNKKLVWVWNNPTGTITVNWENINYDDGGIRYTEYANQSGFNTLVSEIRIPK
jgi:hypothetical protein